MRICVFGAGSLGSALGGMLAKNHDVTLVGRRRHVQAVKRFGLRMRGDISHVVRLKASTDVSGVETPDLLIISTKAYDTSSAVTACGRLVGEKTLVLTLQNGLGNLERLRDWRGEKGLGGTTTMGAALISPGVVRVSGFGRTIIGADRNPTGAKVIARAFGSCGIRAQVKRDAMREIWGKAVINACINPTAAVLRVRNGSLLKSDAITHFMKDVCEECEQVAEASGVVLPSKHMFTRVRAVCSDTRGNISSMLQDVQKGKQTEIQQINGAFCMYGRNMGIRTPLNETLVAMIEPLQLFEKGERLIS